MLLSRHDEERHHRVRQGAGSRHSRVEARSPGFGAQRQHEYGRRQHERCEAEAAWQDSARQVAGEQPTGD